MIELLTVFTIPAILERKLHFHRINNNQHRIHAYDYQTVPK